MIGQLSWWRVGWRASAAASAAANMMCAAPMRRQQQAPRPSPRSLPPPNTNTQKGAAPSGSVHATILVPMPGTGPGSRVIWLTRAGGEVWRGGGGRWVDQVLAGGALSVWTCVFLCVLRTESNGRAGSASAPPSTRQREPAAARPHTAAQHTECSTRCNAKAAAAAAVAPCRRPRGSAPPSCRRRRSRARPGYCYCCCCLLSLLFVVCCLLYVVCCRVGSRGLRG